MKRRPAIVAPIGEILSVRGLLIRAALLAMAFAIAHAAGLRERTSVLCGTLPEGGAFPVGAALLGLVYVFLHMAVTVVVPILVVAAGLRWLLDRLLPARRRSADPRLRPGSAS